MQPDFLSMLKSALAEAMPAIPYFVFILAFIFALQALEAKFGRKRRSKKWRSARQYQRRPWRHTLIAPKHDPSLARVPDAADQLRRVMNANFIAQPLLNKSEARLFRVLDKLVIELAPPGWQVMAQVSLGEILRCADKAAYSCINAKRVDLLIVDAESQPLHAIEYQGGGHFNGAHATAARDAVKKEALRRAGIGYVEVVAGDHTPAELRKIVEKLVQRAPA